MFKTTQKRFLASKDWRFTQINVHEAPIRGQDRGVSRIE